MYDITKITNTKKRRIDMIIIMLGAPGTGKGTVGNLLAQKLKIPHISSGEIFRSYIHEADEIGEQVKAYVQEGRLVPDELTIKLLEKRLSEPDTQKGCILDGYPRTVVQAESLDDLLKTQRRKVKVAVNLSLTDDEIVERISKRRTCPNADCREIYNLDFRKPKVDNICDKCGSELIIREDDNEQTVRKRLENYHNISENLIEFYKHKDILYTVKLNNESNKVSSDIAEEIEEYLKK